MSTSTGYLSLRSWCGEPDIKVWHIADLSVEDRLEILYAIRNKTQYSLISLLCKYELMQYFDIPISLISRREELKYLLFSSRFVEVENIIIAELGNFNSTTLHGIGFDKLAHKIINTKAGSLHSARNMFNMTGTFFECYALVMLSQHACSMEQLSIVSKIIFEILNYTSMTGRSLLLTPLSLVLSDSGKRKIMVNSFAKLPSRTLLAALCFVAMFKTDEQLEYTEKLLANLPAFYNDGQYQRTLIRTILLLQKDNKPAAYNLNLIKVFEKILAPIKTNIIFEPISSDYVVVDHNSLDLLVSEVNGSLTISIKGIDKANRQFTASYPTPKALLPTPLSKKDRIKAKLLALSPQIISTLQKGGIIDETAILQQKSLSILSALSILDDFADMISLANNLSIFELEKQYVLAFSEAFKISTDEFKNYIKPLRKNEAILLYRNSLLALDQGTIENADGQPSTPYIALLNKFVHMLAKPSYATYKKSRYYPEVINKHFTTISTAHNKTYELWQDDSFLPLVAIQQQISCQTQDNNSNIDAYCILYNAIVKHNHLDLRYFAAIDAYFKNGNDGAKIALQSMQEDHERLNKNNIILKLIIKAKDSKNPKHIMQEVTNAVSMLSMISYPATRPQLLRDLMMLSNAIHSLSLETKDTNIANLRVANTDAPWQMFLIGTDVLGSCQHVESQGTNKALIGGYVMSGHVRQIAILDSTDKIIARSILRLLWDPENSKPVLHIEEIYPAISSVFIKEAILYYARLVGLKLELDVTSSQPSAKICPPYDYRLQCLHVNLAEYVDTLGSQTNEPYELQAKSTTLLFNFTQQRFERTTKMLGPERPLKDTSPGIRGIIENIR